MTAREGRCFWGWARPQVGVLPGTGSHLNRAVLVAKAPELLEDTNFWGVGGVMFAWFRFGSQACCRLIHNLSQENNLCRTLRTLHTMCYH